MSLNLLCEFQLIQLAYKVWYKKDLPEEKINKIFSEYMINGIIPIWVTYYANDILKLDGANKLNSYDNKYHVYDHEFGEYIPNEKHRKKKGIQYAIIIVVTFIVSHIMAANYVEETSDFMFPPYIEKSVVYPELNKNKNNN